MEEILALPEFPHVVWNLTPDQSGRLPVAVNRGGPVNIEWEVHGRGDIKLIVCYLTMDFLRSRAGLRALDVFLHDFLLLFSFLERYTVCMQKMFS